ncbi:unnamed protein product [Mytilus coruscus]|uniref:Ig-like domain-containing protein n=1 Tax=Mytilus coruscus TaxID=42192 RepID=A0A6J8BCI0_MYTCO|nr:unnamed protein product [Mytilus coruscus]
MYTDIVGPGSSIRFDPVNNTVTKKIGDTLGPIGCTAVCNPPCQYKWTKPDKSIINDDELSIQSLSTVDHGSFICTATNGIDKSQDKTLDVTVNYGPSAVILLPPTLQYTVRYGQNISSINCSANCRPECKHIWAGPNVPSDTSNVLRLQNIMKNQSGDFQCMVDNEVGSLQSAIINVNVQYEPIVNRMSINGTNFTVRENTTVILSCNFEGNPSPKNTWEKNSILLGEAEENNKRSYYTIERSRCEDGGNYSCVANNSLGISSAEQSLFVTCSPRLNFDVEQPLTKIGLPKGADLVLTVHLISYPPPQSTVWSFKDESGNETSISAYLNTYETFKHVTVLRKTDLTEYDFGDYILKVNNSLGSRIQTYHVVPQGKIIYIFEKL